MFRFEAEEEDDAEGYDGSDATPTTEAWKPEEQQQSNSLWKKSSWLSKEERIDYREIMTAVQDKKTFPEADVDKELNPGHNKTVEADSTSSKIAANKEKADAENAKKKAGGGSGGDPLKTTVIMSMIFAAVAGAAFGIAKILREKR